MLVALPPASSHCSYNNFIILSEVHQLQIDLMVFGMEFRTYESMTQIERLIAEYATKILSPFGRLIYKKFGSKILQAQGSGVSLIGSMFNKVQLAWTELFGSFTSELYLICDQPIIGKTRRHVCNK